MSRHPHVDLAILNIRKAMQAQNISAPKLAAKAGINQSGVYDIMADGRVASGPRLDTVVKIASALDIHPSMLFFEPSDDDLNREIEAAMNSLPDQERRRALALLRALATDPSSA